MPEEEACWQAVMRRDRSFDGRFVTGVLSTGIYCRPSCAARHPARSNVRFFASPGDAKSTGLRACLRCRPDDLARDEAAVAMALDLLRSDLDERITLADLGERTGYSPAHFQKVFTRAVGLSPAAYARAIRAEHAGEALTAGARVTDAIYEAGYGAPSRFYEASKERMGMAPSAWRNGGQGVAIRWALVPTSLGQMLLAVTDKGICRLSFNEGPEELAARFPRADLSEGGTEFAEFCQRVVAAVEEPSRAVTLPIDVRGTVFQEAVWTQLREIPAGETRSYGEIAARLGKPGASRAVGQANGANPVAVLTPCHRVVAADGSLGGYAYGEPIKRELLRREADSKA
ncbi:MAG: methylated-DNA--[protein]-cysteine S-methyltransferase [Novosphingobium sp.]|nr:methylated-DNA--[protein]-cysteine S-methyltransferase [Novosphingobium sp.]